MRVLLLLIFALSALPANAANTPTESQTNVLAQVISIVSQSQRPVPDTNVTTTFQTLRAELLEGPNKGDVVTVLNDYLVLSVGEKFYALHTVDAIDNVDNYTVSEPYRLPQLLILIGIFIAVVILFGGWQGMRALLALTGSLIFIFYLLLPGILHDFSPVLVATGVASLIILLGSYVTHGFNKVTTAAVCGMIATIGITGAFAYFAIHWTHLSGFGSEETVSLNFDTGGKINFISLLLGAVLIGLLGVLYDAAIGQAVAIDELVKAKPDAGRRYIFSRALRIGREHIGALVNTLAIAYVGVSLPLLLLFYNLSPDASIAVTLNREIFATEIVRILVGSIGVVLAVPITTAIGVYLLDRHNQKN